MLAQLAGGFYNAVIADFNFLYMIGGVILGVVLGAIPGLTCLTAIALIVPLTYYMDTITAMALLIAIYIGGIYGGSISAILLGTPGTPASAATTLDGYQMAKQGRGGKALKAAVVASSIGILFSALVLTFLAGPVASLALKFGPGEYTVLLILALSVIGSVAGKSLARGMLCALVGIFFSTIGLDPLAYASRYSFGRTEFLSGFEMSVVLIGLLAVSELLVQIEQLHRKNKNKEQTVLLPPPKTADDMRFTLKDQKSCAMTTIRGSIIGVIVGILPAMGSAIASYMSYDFAKRGSKHPEQFGKGAVEGVVASEVANNAVCGAAMVPLLAFGIPGDAVAAVLIGVFMIQGLSPGPAIFNQAPELVYSIYASFIVGSLLLVAIMFILLPLFVKVAKVPMSIVFPCVIVACIIGAYAARQNPFDILVMLFFALIGYLMIKFGFPTTPMLIGYILGPMLEKYFRQALIISQYDFMIFFSTPVTWILWALTLFSVVSIVSSKKKNAMLKMSEE